MAFRYLVFLAFTALAACSTTARVEVPQDTRLIILRHADREGEELTAKGIARSNALVGVLSGVELDAIYSPGIKRNLDTAAPLSAARNIPIMRIPSERPAARLMALGAGKSIIWIGNKGNLQSIWDSLEAPGRPPLEYGELFFVTREGTGPVTVERRTFGP